MPGQNGTSVESKGYSSMNNLSLRIKIPQSAAEKLEALAKDRSNPLAKLGIARICVDGENTIEIPPYSPASPNKIGRTPGRKIDSDQSSGNSGRTSLVKPSYPRSKDVLKLGPSYIRKGAISPKPPKRKRDPSSHPPFECDLPPDNPPPPATAPVAQPQTLVGNQSLMVQLTNPNSATVTARNIVLPGDQAAAQSVISAAIIMSNIAQYERAIEAVLHKAATGQDLTCYLAEVDPTADLDSIPPVTPKSVDLNTSDSTNATVVEQPESATSEHSNNTDLQSAQIALQTQQMTTQQTLANPGLVVRTGPQVGPPPQTPTAVMGSHTPTMGMHGRPAMWGYDSSAPSPHGAYIMASPGDPSMGFAPHDPMSGRPHPSPVKIQSPMMSHKMGPAQSPSYAPLMYRGHSPYGRMAPSQPAAHSPYGAPPHATTMGQFSPNFGMTSPIGGGTVLQTGMNPYILPPSQMNKPPPPPPPAQMLQQHSPIAIATQHPQTTAVVNSGLTTKDFLPSLQHSHPQMVVNTDGSGGNVGIGGTHGSGTAKETIIGVTQRSGAGGNSVVLVAERAPPPSHMPTSANPNQHFQTGSKIVSTTQSSQTTGKGDGLLLNHSSNEILISNSGLGQGNVKNQQIQKAFASSTVAGTHTKAVGSKNAPTVNTAQMHVDSNGNNGNLQFHPNGMNPVTTCGYVSVNVSPNSSMNICGPVDGRSKLQHLSRSVSVTNAVASMSFASIEDDLITEPSPMPPPSPAPSAGSVKQNQNNLNSELLPEENVTRYDDLNLGDFDSATRRLLTDVVQEFEKSRGKSELNGVSTETSRMSACSTPVNPGSMSQDLTGASSSSLMADRIVTEVRIPGNKSVNEQIVPETILVSKTVPVINTNPVSTQEKKEKKRKDGASEKGGRSRVGANNGEDKKKSLGMSNSVSNEGLLTMNKVASNGPSSLEMTQMLQDNTSCNFGSSFGSQSSSSFSSEIFGNVSHSENELFSQFGNGPLLFTGPHDFETISNCSRLDQKSFGGSNGASGPMKLDPKSVETDEQCKKLLDQILESTDVTTANADFNLIPSCNVTSINRSMSQPAVFVTSNNHQLNSIHGITESLGISEMDMNLLQQSMDMAQASTSNSSSNINNINNNLNNMSNGNAGSTNNMVISAATKPRKRSKSNISSGVNSNSKMLGEPVAKQSMQAHKMHSVNSYKSTTSPAAAETANASLPNDETLLRNNNNNINKPNSESSFCSTKFESVIDKVLSDKKCYKSMYLNEEPDNSNLSSTLPLDFLDDRALSGNMDVNSNTSLVSRKNSGALSSEASLTMPHSTTFVEELNVVGRQNSDYINYNTTSNPIVTAGSATTSSNPMVVDHQYIKQTELHQEKHLTSEQQQMKTGGNGLVVQGTGPSVVNMMQQHSVFSSSPALSLEVQQSKYQRSSPVAKNEFIVYPASPITSNYGMNSSPGGRMDSHSDMLMKRAKGWEATEKTEEAVETVAMPEGDIEECKNNEEKTLLEEIIADEVISTASLLDDELAKNPAQSSSDILECSLKEDFLTSPLHTAAEAEESSKNDDSGEIFEVSVSACDGEDDDHHHNANPSATAADAATELSLPATSSSCHLADQVQNEDHAPREDPAIDCQDHVDMGLVASLTEKGCGVV